MTSPISDTVPAVDLCDGTTIPQLGYGVFLVEPNEAARCVRDALDAGYRSIDTAMIYHNETGVGEGLRASGLAREDVYVTTKLWNTDHDAAEQALQDSLARLELEYVDLYLIHWPAPWQGKSVEAWTSLVDLQERGLTRSIGVSNFHQSHLTAAIDATGVTPVVNQIELHPYFQQRELSAFCAEHDIAVEAWSPLGQGGELLDDPVITELAYAHGVSPAQVVLRWHLQLGNVVIPKSANAARMRENFDVFSFELTAADMQRMAELDREDGRIGPNPDTATF